MYNHHHVDCPKTYFTSWNIIIVRWRGGGGEGGGYHGYCH